MKEQDKQGRGEAREGVSAYPHFDETAVFLRYLRLLIQVAKHSMRTFADSHRRVPIKLQSNNQTEIILF